MIYINKIFIIVLYFVIFNCNAVLAKDKNANLTKFGDVMQVLNPLATAGLVAFDKDDDLLRYTAIYAENLAIVYIMKYTSSKIHLKVSKRPISERRYDGMPSGHTASAWLPASYIRIFNNNSILSVPLYITAGITGYSRIKNKQHSVLQVITGAMLSEVVTYVNHKFFWKNGSNISINLLPKECKIGFNTNF